MSRNRTALRTQKRKAIRLDLPAAQQYHEQRVHIQIADLVLNILRNVALLQDFQNLQAQPCDKGLRRSVFKHLFDSEWHDSLLLVKYDDALGRRVKVMIGKSQDRLYRHGIFSTSGPDRPSLAKALSTLAQA
jgi:hypothetical protein